MDFKSASTTVAPPHSVFDSHFDWPEEFVRNQAAELGERLGPLSFYKNSRNYSVVTYIHSCSPNEPISTTAKNHKVPKTPDTEARFLNVMLLSTVQSTLSTQAQHFDAGYLIKRVPGGVPRPQVAKPDTPTATLTPYTHSEDMYAHIDIAFNFTRRENGTTNSSKMVLRLTGKNCNNMTVTDIQPSSKLFELIPENRLEYEDGIKEVTVDY